MTSQDEYDSTDTDAMSTRSGMTSETASLITPNDSPYGSVMAVETVSSDMDALGLPPQVAEDYDSTEGGDTGCSALADDFATPRARQVPFTDMSPAFESPSKTKSMARVVGKAKTLVKALVRRRKVRTTQRRHPLGCYDISDVSEQGVPKFEDPSETIATSFA